MAKRGSILDYCVRSAGVHRGALTAAWVAQWAITADELGRFPTTVEYADYWAMDERTAWRHRASIKAVFGDVEPVVMAVASEVGARRSPRDVMGLPAPVVAA